MKKSCVRKIIWYIFVGIVGITTCLLMIPAGILILMIDILWEIINKIMQLSVS